MRAQFEHLFPDNRFDDLPKFAGILSRLQLPLAVLEKQTQDERFKQLISAGTYFVERNNIEFLDQAHISIWLKAVKPSDLNAHWLIQRVKSLMKNQEALGGIGTEYLDGLLALTVIGVLDGGLPSGLIWLSRGDVVAKEEPSRVRRAKSSPALPI